MSELDPTFELCKEVYEKTGWDDGIDWLVKVNVGLDSEYISRRQYDEDDVFGFKYEMREFGDNSVPLYTSDYLLEKLPKKNIILSFDEISGTWRTIYGADIFSTDRFRGNADTPLKSLLKLTKTLHDAGVKL